MLVLVLVMKPRSPGQLELSSCQELFTPFHGASVDRDPHPRIGLDELDGWRLDLERDHAVVLSKVHSELDYGEGCSCGHKCWITPVRTDMGISCSVDNFHANSTVVMAILCRDAEQHRT